MIGVLLVNMGGPQSQKEMKQFLKRMFLDPCILPFNKLGRRLLSFIISNTRFRKSWKKYIQIGGTPIITSTNILKEHLEKSLGDDYFVRAAYSYSKPLIKDAVKEMAESGIKKIQLLTMYPHASISTTKSIELDVNKACESTNIEIIDCGEYYKHKLFIKFWSEIIKEHILEHNLSQAILLFSAHSIPECHIKDGDMYGESISESVKLIAQNLNMDYELAYQSQMKKGEWLGPESDMILQKIADKNTEVIIIPISFVSENLETLYDIDLNMVSKNKQKFKSLTRVRIPDGHPLMTELYKCLIVC